MCTPPEPLVSPLAVLQLSLLLLQAAQSQKHIAGNHVAVRIACSYGEPCIGIDPPVARKLAKASSMVSSACELSQPFPPTKRLSFSK